MEINNNTIIVYGGHGREFKRVSFIDENNVSYRGTGNEAKSYYRDLYPSKSISFKEYRKR